MGFSLPRPAQDYGGNALGDGYGEIRIPNPNGTVLKPVRLPMPAPGIWK